MRLLETALDAGITHFDVARSYGDGAAEQALGQIARRRRREMTIVTKAGMAPPTLAGRVARRLGGARSAHRSGLFAPDQVARSVESSLRALATDHIDALLLHECEPEHVTEALILRLGRLISEGKIGAFGIATSSQATDELRRRWPQTWRVVQLADDPSLPLPAGGRSIFVTHSVVSGARLRERCSPAAELAIRAAMERNRSGVVLFSSCNPQHIQKNALLAERVMCPALAGSAVATCTGSADNQLRQARPLPRGPALAEAP